MRMLDVLFVDDVPDDVQRLESYLAEAGYAGRRERVATEAEFLAAVRGRHWAVILAEYRLARFGALTALHHLRAEQLDIPLIIVSASPEDEAAVLTLKAGAQDFIPKDRPTRLASAIEREVRAARVRGQHRESDAALQQSEARFRAFMNHSPVVAFMKTEDGRYVYLNERFTDRFHHTIADLVDRTDRDWMPAEIAAPLVANDQRVLQLNKPLEFFEDIPDAHGIVRHWFVVKFPFTDAGGHRYVGGMAVDMTARKQAEVALTETRAELQAILQARTAELLASNELLQAKQAQLIQTAKLASLGELTAGVAHELNNPLNNISLCIANAVEAWTNPSEPREVLPHSLRLAQSEVQKAAHILTHLRTFGRAATGERSPQALHPIIRNALSLFEVPLRQAGVEVIVDVDLGHPVVLGDAIQLEQVFINLLQNAKDALVEAPQKRLYVTTRITEGSVYATVRDTGAGIPHAIKERIFDPFFTTKPIGHGTGLGLSISYGIIESHRGRLWVEDPPDGGAAFVMQLPLATPN